MCRTALLLLASVMLVQHSFAHIAFPGLPFPFLKSDRHKARTPKSAVVGMDTQVLKPNAPGIEGGYQVRIYIHYNDIISLLLIDIRW